MNARGLFSLCIAAAALVAARAGHTQESEAGKPYTVECAPDPDEGGAMVCRVDRATYVGWRTFHGICHTCHAQDAVGSTFAPDLLERMRHIDKTEFMKALNDGFQGQVGVMPPWSQDPNVSKYFEELWSYLRARSDGALLPGRPKRLPAEP
jgi:cytochrome c5